MPRLPAAGDLAAEYLPHAAPFLLLDRIVALAPPSGTFTKCVTASDPLLAAGGALSPLLLVEAMAQGAGILLMRDHPGLVGRGAMLAAIDHCEVAGTAAAGDVLTVEVTLLRRYGDMARVRGTARVDDRPCAAASLTLALAPEAAAAAPAS
jgi:3-hydroxymyristoyl/3-hydroxydecanoyl-(acyl carrier protein) dehydratase